MLQLFYDKKYHGCTRKKGVSDKPWQNILHAEAATRGVLWEKLFLEISENSQENTCVRVSFLIKMQASAWNFIKKETLVQVFSSEFCEICKNTCFTEHFRTTALYMTKPFRHSKL